MLITKLGSREHDPHLQQMMSLQFVNSTILGKLECPLAINISRSIRARRGDVWQSSSCQSHSVSGSDWTHQTCKALSQGVGIPRRRNDSQTWNIVPLWLHLVLGPMHSPRLSLDQSRGCEVWSGSACFSLRNLGHRDISVICLTVVWKLAATMFISLYFQTFWPKWLNFFRSFQKTFRSMTEENPESGHHTTSVSCAVTAIGQLCWQTFSPFFDETQMSINLSGVVRFPGWAMPGTNSSCSIIASAYFEKRTNCS